MSRLEIRNRDQARERDGKAARQLTWRRQRTPSQPPDHAKRQPLAPVIFKVVHSKRSYATEKQHLPNAKRPPYYTDRANVKHGTSQQCDRVITRAIDTWRGGRRRLVIAAQAAPLRPPGEREVSHLLSS